MRHLARLRLAMPFALLTLALLPQPSMAAGPALITTTAATYYEDSAGNLCVGLGTPFPTGDCEFQALTTGIFNTAVGLQTLRANTEGAYNSAVGQGALESNSTGSSDSAFGGGALQSNTVGDNNVAVGDSALTSAKEASGNVAVGSHAGTAITQSNNVDIANAGQTGDTGTTRIGTEGTQTKAFLAGVYNADPAGTTCGVVVNSSGQLGCGTAGTTGGPATADFTFFNGENVPYATSPVFDAQGYTQVTLTGACPNASSSQDLIPEVSADGSTWLPLSILLCGKTPTGVGTIHFGSSVYGFGTPVTLPTAARYYRIHNAEALPSKATLYVIGQFSN
jgi:hypothetical protein